ncbi:1,4-dihydroxy-2-naphthoate polyprenyltransferase [Oceanobacter mangrovi]|uniref:1,4-dihydroxy-2-naphthoate polyprenyltransferase n=1 Tax=Oceanobacter mangrovi TaxID=2862510 RepID=UPI001C8EB8F0
MNYWVQAIRPKTIPASIGPVLLGSALAANQQALDMGIFLLAMLCSVLLQIGVNLANDLFDGLGGIDTDERLGPARMVQSGFISPKSMIMALALCTLAAMATGVALAALTDWRLLWVGLLCILAVFAYSTGPLPLASKGLGEVAVLAFFGWVAVAGSYWLQTGEINSHALMYGTTAGLFSVAILLINNIRDIPTDSKAGKFTLAVRLGDKASRALFVASMVAALLLHLWISWPDYLLLLVPVLLCSPMVWSLSQRIFITQGRDMNDLLALTAKTGLLYCTACAIMLVLESLF